MLDTAIREARQREMLMFEIEATIARSALTTNESANAWSGAAKSLSRPEVMMALESMRGETSPIDAVSSPTLFRRRN